MKNIEPIVYSGDGFSFDVLKSPSIKSFYRYWLDKCRDDHPPLANEIDVVDLPDCVGSISFIDVELEPLRFFMRMIGSEIVSRHGEDLTNQYVDDHQNHETREILLGSYKTVVKTEKPFWIERRTITDHHIFIYECLILPTMNNKGRVSRLVSILDWHDE
jgi:hypothetical protein